MKMPGKGTTNIVDKMPGADSTQKINTYENGAEFKRKIDNFCCITGLPMPLRKN